LISATSDFESFRLFVRLVPQADQKREDNERDLQRAARKSANPCHTDKIVNRAVAGRVGRNFPIIVCVTRLAFLAEQERLRGRGLRAAREIKQDEYQRQRTAWRRRRIEPNGR
jgi:hypothetical protein